MTKYCNLYVEGLYNLNPNALVDYTEILLCCG